MSWVRSLSCSTASGSCARARSWSHTTLLPVLCRPLANPVVKSELNLSPARLNESYASNRCGTARRIIGIERYSRCRRSRPDKSVQGLLGPAQGTRGRWRGFRSAKRRSVWTAWAEWFGQVHHDQDAARVAASDQGRHRSLRALAARCEDQGAHRLPAGGVVFVSLPRFARDAGFLRQPGHAVQRGAPAPLGTVARNGWADGGAHPGTQRLDASGQLVEAEA